MEKVEIQPVEVQPVQDEHEELSNLRKENQDLKRKLLEMQNENALLHDKIVKACVILKKVINIINGLM